MDTNTIVYIVEALLLIFIAIEFPITVKEVIKEGKKTDESDT